MTSICYLRRGKRRPVRLRPVPMHGDRENRIPYGWCRRCGAEIHEQGADECPRCRKKEETENEGHSQ